MYIDGKWYTEPELEAYVKELKARVKTLEVHKSKSDELLKAAVEDVRYCMRSYDPCEICALLGEDGECPATDDDDCGEKYKWRYEDEALKLIGG